jgi:hypothetical protein
MDSMEEWERKAPIRRECRLGKIVAKNHSAGIRDVKGLIIKNRTQIPQERFRLR